MSPKNEFSSPWPAPEALWADPPWILSGTAITAWFETDTSAVVEELSPAFVPMRGERGTPTRLRFYEINYEPRDGDAKARASSSGTFREAVIAFKGTITDVDGEFSAYMWTDDDRYMTWGREIFGWPLVRGDIRLSGALWGSSVEKSTVCQLVQSEYTLSIEVDSGEGTKGPEGPAVNWLTPRRILFPGGGGSERRDLNIVRPTVLEAGRSLSHGGRVNIESGPAGVMSKFTPLGSVAINSLTGFRICVGDHVETITSGP